jgi:predicted RNase H-like HicB family nuclease
MREFQFTVVIEQDEDGRFVALCPALRGCYSEGQTEVEAMEMIQDAIRLHLEESLLRGVMIPKEISARQIYISV